MRHRAAAAVAAVTVGLASTITTATVAYGDPGDSRGREVTVLIVQGPDEDCSSVPSLLNSYERRVPGTAAVNLDPPRLWVLNRCPGAFQVTFEEPGWPAVTIPGDLRVVVEVPSKQSGGRLCSTESLGSPVCWDLAFLPFPGERIAPVDKIRPPVPQNG